MKDSGYLSPSSGSETDENIRHVNKRRRLDTRPGIIYDVL